MAWLEAIGVQSLLLFAATVFAVNATPGADLLLAFTNTMKHGVRGGLATAAGTSAGALVHTVLVALGVAALIAATPHAYRALQWVGAAYLVWLAITLVRDGLREPVGQDASDAEIAAIGQVPGLTAPAPPATATAPSATARSAAGATLDAAAPLGPVFVQGLTTNVLNPKVLLFFLALLPQFVASQTASKTPALAFLGVWFAVQGFVFLAFFVRLVAMMRRWQPSPARRRMLHFAAASVLLGVALRMVLAGSAT